jgi:hypothetical protein
VGPVQSPGLGKNRVVICRSRWPILSSDGRAQVTPRIVSRRPPPGTLMDSKKSTTRRDFVQAGSLGLLGITLPSLLANAANQGLRPGAARSCIVFFLDGGPAQQDMWDMKPAAPVEVRGAFSPISTTVPGLQVCEHIPLVAQQMHHLALVRSVTHDVMVHSAATYYMLTGRHPTNNGSLIIKERPGNFPPYGSVIAKRRPLADLPEFVHLPDIMWDAGHDLPGQRAGFMGSNFDPLVAGDPSVPAYRIPGLKLPGDVSQTRFARRHELLSSLQRTADGRVQPNKFVDLDWRASVLERRSTCAANHAR